MIFQIAVLLGRPALPVNNNHGNVLTMNGICPAHGMGTDLLKLTAIGGVQLGSCDGATNVATGELVTEGSVVRGIVVSVLVWMS